MNLHIAGIQFDTIWQDRDGNLAALRPLVGQAAAAGARLVVLPEMFSTGFSMNTDVVAEPVGGPSSDFLSSVATDNDCWVGGSIPELDDGGDRPTNTFVLAAPDGDQHRYRKIHPFAYADEHDHYAPGDEFVTVDVDGVRCTLFVCYDLRFADEFWRTGPDTDCFLIPANWPAPRREHWITLLRARAIENQCYVVGINRVGDGDGLHYTGDSMIVDPLGQVLASAAHVPTTIHATVDPARVRQVRADLPFLQDRRRPDVSQTGHRWRV
jgi:predicted amidohydrolase